MRATTWLLTLLILIPAVTAFAQDEAPAEGEVPEVPPQIAEQMERFQDMGMDPGEAMFLSVLTSGQLDTTQMLMLMMMAGEGNIGGDAFGFLMLMDAMKAQKQTGQPLILERGDTLLIIDSGVLYKVNLETMELEGSVPYARAAGADAEALMSLLGMMMAHRVERGAEVAVVDEDQDECIGNLRGLCLAALIRAEDFEGKLPGETWVADIRGYHEDDQVLVCPSRPDLAVGYAMNRKLVGAKFGEMHEPAEVILFFESNLGGENPVGGPDDVPEEGVHDEGIHCAFVDGHVKWLSVAEARELLEQDPFE